MTVPGSVISAFVAALFFAHVSFALGTLPHSPLNATVIAAAQNAHYGYVPHEGVAILFLALYGISTLFRLLPTAALCGIGEILGWGGRLWSSIRPIVNTPYLMQISATIITPTPLLAATFIVFSHIVQQLGTAYSWLMPKWYTILFLPCDMIALVVQGVGDGMTSEREGPRRRQWRDILCPAAIILFSAIACDFLQRYLGDRPVRADRSARRMLPPCLKLMFAAFAFSTTTLFIRSVYQIIELADGREGRIIHAEVYFNVLDGEMVVLAICMLNLAHPGRLLRAEEARVTEKEIAMESLESRETLAV
ncbi:RTA1-like protein [Mycena latifolia]|nr:RTA1-like protein [Mycena latifolia]